MTGRFGPGVVQMLLKPPFAVLGFLWKNSRFEILERTWWGDLNIFVFSLPQKRLEIPVHPGLSTWWRSAFAFDKNGLQANAAGVRVAFAQDLEQGFAGNLAEFKSGLSDNT